jgi:biotin carboxyl carrier protein
VDVQREGRTYRVTVDGRPHLVDLARTSRAWSLLVGRRSYELFFADQAGGAMTVHVNGHPVAVARGGAGRRNHDGTGSAAAHDGPQRVVAPMPGRVIKVLVKKDDAVAARQPLVVVEAMKMENELRSPRAGVVAEVKVTEGMSVEANTVLVVVE